MNTEDEKRLMEIEARNEARTPGRWFWDTNRRHRSVMLKAPHDGGTCVMGFVRWGMHSAQPVFNDTAPQFGGILRSMEEYDKHPELKNPNADFIERASDDIPYLLGLVSDLRAQNEKMRAALNFYATNENWIGMASPMKWSDFSNVGRDYGFIAIRALQEAEAAIKDGDA